VGSRNVRCRPVLIKISAEESCSLFCTRITTSCLFHNYTLDSGARCLAFSNLYIIFVRFCIRLLTMLKPKNSRLIMKNNHHAIHCYILNRSPLDIFNLSTQILLKPIRFIVSMFAVAATNVRVQVFLRCIVQRPSHCQIWRGNFCSRFQFHCGVFDDEIHTMKGDLDPKTG
jgi:hypothetical protein